MATQVIMPQLGRIGGRGDDHGLAGRRRPAGQAVRSALTGDHGQGRHRDLGAGLGYLAQDLHPRGADGGCRHGAGPDRRCGRGGSRPTAPRRTPGTAGRRTPAPEAGTVGRPDEKAAGGAPAEGQAAPAATPVAQRMAQEHGVDLTAVQRLRPRRSYYEGGRRGPPGREPGAGPCGRRGSGSGATAGKAIAGVHLTGRRPPGSRVPGGPGRHPGDRRRPGGSPRKT